MTLKSIIFAGQILCALILISSEGRGNNPAGLWHEILELRQEWMPQFLAKPVITDQDSRAREENAWRSEWFPACVRASNELPNERRQEGRRECIAIQTIVLRFIASEEPSPTQPIPTPLPQPTPQPSPTPTPLPLPEDDSWMPPRVDLRNDRAWIRWRDACYGVAGTNEVRHNRCYEVFRLRLLPPPPPIPPEDGWMPPRVGLTNDRSWIRWRDACYRVAGEDEGRHNRCYEVFRQRLQ